MTLEKIIDGVIKKLCEPLKEPPCVDIDMNELVYIRLKGIKKALRIIAEEAINAVIGKKVKVENKFDVGFNRCIEDMKKKAKKFLE